jgi:hypothetical protein
MGSSPERIRIADMGDVVYYRQVKDYSDQDYESSRDLQRAVKRGALTVLEHYTSPKSINESFQEPSGRNNSTAPLDIELIKRAVREAFPEAKNQDVGSALRDLIPTLMTAVRQEMASMRMGGAASEAVKSESLFTGPEYIPTVTTEGMVSNISVEAKESSGSEVSSNLELLRKLQQKSK